MMVFLQLCSPVHTPYASGFFCGVGPKLVKLKHHQLHVGYRPCSSEVSLNDKDKRAGVGDSKKRVGFSDFFSQIPLSQPFRGRHGES